MNVPHKCHFHPNNLITKFCSNRECTLPLCAECESIHLDEHYTQQTQPKLLRFNEAYLRAVNDIQDYLENQIRYQRQQSNRIENDHEMVVRMIEQYYTKATKIIQESKNKAQQAEEKLNKLKKGSIKTLIFYYSGDIELNIPNTQFDTLNSKIKTILQGKCKIQAITKQQHCQNKITTQNTVYKVGQKTTEQMLENVKNLTKSIDGNMFSNIEEIKRDKSRQKGRRSIFQNKKQSNISQNSLNKEETNKYSYSIPNQKQEIVEIVKNRLDHPKYQYQQNNMYLEERPLTVQEETPISFQHRFVNKFTGEKYEVQQHYPVTINPINRQFMPHQLKKEQLAIPVQKVLKQSDLHVQKENQYFHYKNGINSEQVSQRNRVMSQTNIIERQPRRTNQEDDLKKQVLSPEQIRKILQKRIEQRNRVLSIKKTDNYQPRQPEQKNPKKEWQTRDSIINQIYTDNKY